MNSNNFIRAIVAKDVSGKKHGGKVATRFPPEPNGYLHIGHAKSICLNFSISEDFAGRCNLRMDDSNPENESIEYAKAIQHDVEWLGYKWHELRHASDYFEQLYSFAEQLIEQGQAYVCDLGFDEIREYRGTLTKPGTNSPYRERSGEESLDLFRRMRKGEFADGERVLRARIDMASPNINMRDPIIYRIRRHTHYRTGDKWCIYPMYDYAHCLSDAIEGITHSLCTLEFEDHRPLYDWFLDRLSTPCHPQQIEFARLSLEHTVLSKRRLNQVIKAAHVSGWDDPRLPTISGLRRRGYTPNSIRDFCARIGVTKNEATVEMGVLEKCLREDLEQHAPRALAVLKPLKLVIENYPEGKTEELTAPNHPKDPDMGTRLLPFSGELYIERDDFMEDPPGKFFRLAPGREVRLRYAYYITCHDVIKSEAGEVIELRCSYDPETRGGSSPDGRKVKGTLHWVSVKHAVDAEIRQYDRLFTAPNPLKEDNFLASLNPDSLAVLTDAKLEPSLSSAKPEQRYQFERQGYFCLDAADSPSKKLVFNRAVTLRDTWKKLKK